jgi:hypothetical protein
MACAETTEQLNAGLERRLATPGPFVVEAVI